MGVIIDASFHATVDCYSFIGNTLLHWYVSAVGGQGNEIEPIPLKEML